VDLKKKRRLNYIMIIKGLKRDNNLPNNQELSMFLKKEKIEDLEFMEVDPEDEELRLIVMEEEDKALS
jgi:hypothetical protein